MGVAKRKEGRGEEGREERTREPGTAEEDKKRRKLFLPRRVAHVFSLFSLVRGAQSPEIKGTADGEELESTGQDTKDPVSASTGTREDWHLPTKLRLGE